MNAKDFVRNRPELLLDYNGVGIQVFFIGGETKTLAANGKLRLDTSLIRICNPSATKATLIIENSTSTPMTILPNSKEVLACMVGDVLKVVEGTLEVTLFRDKSK